MKLKSLVLLFVLTAQLFQLSCAPHDGNKISTENWQNIEKDAFTLKLPASMIERKVRGVDTHVYQFEDSNTALNIEYGPLAFFPNIRDRVDDYQEKPVEINGHRGKLISYKEIENGQPATVYVLYFRDIDGTEKNMILWAASKADSEKDIALTILGTVKLKVRLLIEVISKLIKFKSK